MVAQCSSRGRTPTGFASRSVLVVDDDDDSLIVIAHVLEQLACEACFVSDGYGALLAAQRYQPALILSDINLPELDGFSLLRQLRADAATQHIPVVAVTALADSEHLRKIIAAGFNDYITKPFLLSTLEGVVSHFVAR
ncbi:MAG: response regulator [Leptolyngbyaceae cyanobacterium SM2_5_2]|nr:response regulator [Leptolyngbyaceae cyanobacterium SM2_5_2]